MADSTNNPLKLLARFAADRRGSVGPMFALMLIPAMMLVGVAIDYSRTVRAKAQLQASADSVALAIAKSSSMSTQEANELLAAMMSTNRSAIPTGTTITSAQSKDSGRVTVTASVQFPMTIASMITPTLPVRVKAVAVSSTASQAPVCVLALNATASETVRFWGTADLTASNCTVQSNSASSSGMVTGGSATASAAKFCSVGGTFGSGFSPSVRTNCPAITDPYASKLNWTNLATNGLSLLGVCEATRKVSIKNNTTYNAAGGVMRFCDGINIATGATVTFKPGTYIIFNDFDIGSGSSVVATDGVTFILGKGGQNYENGRLKVQGGANFKLKAPTTGVLAGMAVIQPEVSSYIANNSQAALENVIIGGGTINIVGIMYTPQAKLRITGKGSGASGATNANSKYFGIVADFVELEGNGQLAVNADHQSTGMPAMTTSSGGSGGSIARLLD